MSCKVLVNQEVLTSYVIYTLMELLEKAENVNVANVKKTTVSVKNNKITVVLDPIVYINIFDNFVNLTFLEKVSAATGKKVEIKAGTTLVPTTLSLEEIPSLVINVLFNLFEKHDKVKAEHIRNTSVVINDDLITVKLDPMVYLNITSDFLNHEFCDTVSAAANKKVQIALGENAPREMVC